MTMQTLETLDYGDESFPDFLFFISLVFLNFFIDTSEEISLIGKLHYGAVGNKESIPERFAFLIEESLLVADNMFVVYRSEYSDFVKGILFLFLR